MGPRMGLDAGAGECHGARGRMQRCTDTSTVGGWDTGVCGRVEGVWERVGGEWGRVEGVWERVGGRLPQ